MKYLMIKNISLFRAKLLKYFILELLFIILFLIVDFNSFYMFDDSIFYLYLGLTNFLDCDILFKILKIVNLFVVMHITINLFLRDLTNNTEYLFLRMDKKKWVINNIINITIFLIVMRLILNVIVVFFFYLFNHSLTFGFFLATLFKDFLYYEIIVLFTLLLISCLGIKKYIIIIPISFILISMFFDINSINNIYLILINSILIFFNFLIFRPNKIYDEFKKG